MVWCRYPDLRTGHDPFNLGSRFWMCLDSSTTPSFEKLIPTKIQEERSRMSGRIAVLGTCFYANAFHRILTHAACGDAYFTAMIRDGTIRSIKDKPIKYLESEFHSRALVKRDSDKESDRTNLRKRKRSRGNPEHLELQNMTNTRQTTYSPVSEGSFYSVKF